MKSPQHPQVQKVKVIRFFLPIVLFTIVVLYEGWEHLWLKGTFELEFHFTSEVLFFGILGPIAVFAVLSYVASLLEKQIAIGSRLEVLNRSLEQKVAERTAELKARNEELAKANTELQKLDQLKSDFVSLVSHELRGPLATLNGGLEVALQIEDQLPAEARRILKVMSQESQRLTELVKTILDVSRLEAGKIVLNPGLVAIHPLLQRTVDVTCASHQRKILWKIPSDLPPIWADEIYLEEIFCNLLSNAVKYTPEHMPIELSAYLSGNQVQVTITDYGPGIPPEMQSKIFDRFQRIERGDKIATKGWGLGLFFAKALTEAQNGTLTLQSPAHPDKDTPGTAFTVTLPIAAEEPEDD